MEATVAVVTRIRLSLRDTPSRARARAAILRLHCLPRGRRVRRLRFRRAGRLLAITVGRRPLRRRPPRLLRQAPATVDPSSS